MELLVLTTAPDGLSVLPGLELLPHAVTTCTPSIHEFLSAKPCDAALVDGRTHPFAACKQGPRGDGAGNPLIGVIEEMVAPHIGEDCAIVQLVLASAGHSCWPNVTAGPTRPARVPSTATSGRSARSSAGIVFAAHGPRLRLPRALVPTGWRPLTPAIHSPMT